MKKPTLIPQWQRAWRLLSVQAAGLAITFGLLPPEQQQSILAVFNVPSERVPAVLGILFLAGRVLKQPDQAAEAEKGKD